jgi:hypothetical protein
MSIFKRGNVYWYHFMFNGEHIQKSTKQGNPRIGRQIEAAYKTALAKGEVGIIERKKISSFQDAMEDFLTWSKQENQMASSSAERYHYSSLALLKFFGDKRLDKITSEDVERYKTSRAAEFKTVRGKDKNVPRLNSVCGRRQSIANLRACERCSITPSRAICC